MKYLDVLSLGADNHLYNLHAGRMLPLQNKPEEAFRWIQVAVGMKRQGEPDVTSSDCKIYLLAVWC